jgi:fructokinase
MIRLEDLPRALPDETAAITFGSYSLAVEPCGSAYLALARRESGRRIISLDPNVRPTIVGDMAGWRGRFADFAACATLVKASDEDIALAYGPDADIGAVARQWLDLGPKLVVVTQGAQGATAFFGAGHLALPGRPVDVIDTVGAGDTFHAALLARLDQRGRLNRQVFSALTADIVGDLVAYAIAASAITCSRRGADLPRRQDVETALSRGVRQ